MATNPEKMYHDIVNLVLYDCPQAQIELVQRLLLKQMRFLARELCLLQTSVFPLVQDGVSTYDLEEHLPDGFELCDISWVKYCGCCIYPVGECVNCSFGYDMVTDSCLRLHPTPCKTSRTDLEVKIISQPCYDVCFIPKAYTKHYELLHELTTAALLNMPKKPWSDARASARMMIELRGRIVEARDKVMRRHAPVEAPNNLTVAL